MAELLKKEEIGLEPKLSNRWLVRLPEEFDIPEWMVSATSRPRLVVNSPMHSWSPPYIPDNIDITFIDPIAPSTTNRLWDLFIGLSDGELNGIVHEDIVIEMREKFKEFKCGFNYTLEMLDPTGVVIERWKIQGCKIVAFDFGKLDYADDSTAKCSFTVKPKNIILEF